MSVIRKNPYIESVLAAMSDDNLKALKTIINSGGNNVSLSFATLTSAYQNEVTPVLFHFEDTAAKTGILIWPTGKTKATLICYHRFQDLLLFELDTTNKTYEKINEYCDINELRRVLDDTVEAKGQIDSGDANKGQVPVADGNGGVEWLDIPQTLVLTNTSGTLTSDELALAKQSNVRLQLGDNGQFYYKNSQNNYYIIFKATARVANDDTIVEKVTIDLSDNTYAYSYDVVAAGESFTPTYDDELSDASTNAVQNKVVTEALENKANKDGNYPTMSVGEADVAKNLKAYSSDSGALQENPFISQGTGTNNNTEIVTTGNVCEIKSKNGNTIPVIQLADILLPNDSYGLTFTKDHNGYIKINGTTTSADNKILVSNLIAGHKYYITTKNEFPLGFSFTTAYNDMRRKSYVWTAENQYLYMSFQSGIEINNFETIISVFDITSWKDSVISDLTTNPSHFSWYYNGSLAYGSNLVNANGRYLECGQGRNLWDEQTELGGIEADGTLYPDTDRIRSKNYIYVTPNTNYYFYRADANSMRIAYYDKDYNFISYDSNANTTHTTPSNCSFIKIVIYGTTTYANNVTISIYYTPEQGGEGYNQHYDYVAPKVIDTGSEELLAFDKKTPDGTWYHNTGTKTFDANTIWYAGYGGYYTVVNDIKKTASSNDVPSIKCGKYQVVAYGSLADKTFSALVNDKYVIVKDSSFTDVASCTSGMNGVTIEYELADASKTTSQGTPFSPYPDINDYSYMLWKDTDNNLVSVPQGASIFYPVNYAGTLDDLYSYVDGDVTNLAKKSDLASDKAELQGVDTILQNAIGGTLRHMLVNDNLEFANTTYIDLGDQTWIKQTEDVFRCDANIATDVGLGIICPSYESTTVLYSDASRPDKTISGRDGYSRIYIRDSSKSSLDANEFKASVKGLLCAFKKA